MGTFLWIVLFVLCAFLIRLIFILCAAGYYAITAPEEWKQAREMVKEGTQWANKMKAEGRLNADGTYKGKDRTNRMS